MEKSEIIPYLNINSGSRNKSGDNALQLSPIQVKDEYCKEWNESATDFVVLTKNGELISNSLYRVGGMGADIKKDYFLLLKYVEAIYDFKFIKECYPNKNTSQLESLRKHLEGRWCIIDINGNEKVEFNQFDRPYLVSNSCIYSIKSNYYNIETGEFYCNSSSAMSSTHYLFLENNYDGNKSRRGVMKIDKKDGTWELFS